MPTNYLTILKWVGLVALIVAVIGLPILYIQRVESQAFERGKTVGATECEQRHAVQAQLDAEAAKQTILDEAKKAQAAKAEATQLGVKANKLQKALDEALKNSQIPAGCVVPEYPTSLLRDAATGNFSHLGDAVSGQRRGEMPSSPAISGQGQSHPTGFSGSLR